MNARVSIQDKTGPPHRGPVPERPTPTSPSARLAHTERWHDLVDWVIDWWTHPHLAYWRGLRDGYELARAHRAGQDPASIETIDLVGFAATVDARAAADFPRIRPGDFPGGCALPPELPGAGAP